MNTATRNLLMIPVVITVIVLTGMVPAAPWWLFTVPVMLIGWYTAIKGWKLYPFITGFIAGFLAWAGANLLFDIRNGQAILVTVAHATGFSRILLLLAAGSIGGILTALALYTGRSAVAGKTPGLADQIGM